MVYQVLRRIGMESVESTTAEVSEKVNYMRGKC